MHSDPLVISLKKPSPAAQSLPHSAPHAMPEQMPSRSKRRSRRSRQGIYIGVGFALLMGIGIYFSYVHAPSSSDGTITAPEDVDALVAKVGKIILLPDETPNVASIDDLSSLGSDPFFKDATLGDEILTFPQAGRAFLYDPNANKIIAVGPITPDTSDSTGTSNVSNAQ